MRSHKAVFETSPDSGFGEVSKANQAPITKGYEQVEQDGTDPAIYYSTSGVGAFYPRHPARGGARNYADRQSTGLSIAHIINLREAMVHATAIGLPFTRMITIHWEAAGVSAADMAKATGKFIDLLTKALARRSHETAWLWVHESGESRGGHCHMLVHIPAHLIADVLKLQRGWLRRITSTPYRARVIHSVPIGGRLGLERNNPDLHAINLEVTFAYLIKGANTAATARFELTRLKPGGLVIGKRCGTSQNIGSAARSNGFIKSV